MRKFVASSDRAVDCGSRCGTDGGGGASTKKKRASQPYAAQAYSAPRNDSLPGVHRREAPIGSESWWQQMDREGRGGQSQIN